MKALVFKGPRALTVEDRTAPTPGSGEILLRIVATGICGSDLHGFTGENGRRHPGQVMGHETVASVVEDPSGQHEPGAVVTVNPVIGCGRCPNCQRGEPQVCPDRQVIGVTPELSSAFAELMVVPRRNVVVIPPGAALEVGALVEPLAVGYHAARRASIGPDDRVLVIGGGPIGQAAALAAVRSGARSVTVSEPDPGRRALCESLGVQAVDPGAGGADPAESVAAALGGQATVVLDAVGSSTSLGTALEISALGARIVLVGMNSPSVNIPAYAVSTEERSIIGSFCYNEAEFAETAQWAAENADRLAAMVDGRVDLESAPATFTALTEGTMRASKVLVYFGEEADRLKGESR